MHVVGVVEALDVVIPVITGALGLVGGWFSNVAATRRAREGRFASWELKKREVYADFLEAADAFRTAGSPSGKVRRAYLKQLRRARLHAYQDARACLDAIGDDQNKLKDPDTWRTLEEKLRKDALIQGNPT